MLVCDQGLVCCNELPHVYVMRDANASSLLDIFIYLTMYVSPGFEMRMLTGGARDGMHTRYDTYKVRPTSRASVYLRAEGQMLCRVILLLLRCVMGAAESRWLSAFHKRTCLILSMF